MRPNNALQPGGRIVWIDQIKGIAFFFVILGHLSLEPTFKSWVFSFHMPVFFFATGCTYNIDKILRTPFKDYLLKLSKRLLIPYVWMQLLSVVLRYIELARIRHKPVPLVTYLLGIFVGDSNLMNAPSNPLYFVLLLFLAELVLFLLVKLSQGDGRKLAVFCAVLLPFSLLSQKVHTPWHINAVPAVIAMILLGRLLMQVYRKNQARIESLEPVRRFALIAALFSVGALLWFFNGRFGLHGNSYGREFLCAIASAVCTSTALALLVMRLPELRLLTFVGKNTLFYMGFHKPVLLLLEALFREWKNEQWFVWTAAVVCYFLLIPAVLVCEKSAPFVLGKEMPRASLIAKIGEVVCVVGATCVPYLHFVNRFAGGLFRTSVPLELLAVLIYAAAVAGIWLLCRRVLRFPFLPKEETAA